MTPTDAKNRPTARMREGSATDDYRTAMDGEGDFYSLGYQWSDKPHRLVYDLCGEVDFLTRRLAEAERDRDVECEDCGFRYGAEHKHPDKTAKEDCAACEVLKLHADLASCRESLEAALTSRAVFEKDRGELIEGLKEIVTHGDDDHECGHSSLANCLREVRGLAESLLSRLDNGGAA